VIIGHDRLRAALEDRDDRVSLFLGPASVGKFTLARHLAHRRGVRTADLFCLDRLLAADARSVVELSRIQPFGDTRGFIIRLDGASEQAQNILLKVLEEPLPTARFFLVASEKPLPTIISRAVVCYFGLLSDAQVTEILVQTGMDRESAVKQAPLGGGSVRPAIQGISQHALALVTAVLTALAARDAGQLEKILLRWDDDAHQLLIRWSAEAASGRWRCFAPESGPGLRQADARRILGALGTFSAAGPRLAASAALVPLCAR
jgi:replication-associated recombination protein RarA